MKTKQKILIVEDNPDLQDIYQINFEAGGFEVKVSENGIIGMVDVVKEKPDVVLLDIMMPQMNGYEFLVGLKNNSSIDVPVIVCSNLSQESDIDQAKELGADCYIKKSDYEGLDLVEKVRSFLEERKNG